MIIVALLIPALAIAGGLGNHPKGQAPDHDQDTPHQAKPTDKNIGAGALACQPLAESEKPDELDSVQLAYEKQSVKDPNNTDILLALATIAERKNRPDAAEKLRRQAQQANPQSPAVIASVIGSLKGGVMRREAESHLRSWLAAHPRSAALHFTLGNLMAGEGRWDEAELAYFNAVANESGNPDFLFNLAISLDRLRQYHLAIQHYRLALEASDKRPAGFDIAQIRLRLVELQQALSDTR